MIKSICLVLAAVLSVSAYSMNAVPVSAAGITAEDVPLSAANPVSGKAFYPASFNDSSAISGNLGKIDASNIGQGYVLAEYTGASSKAALLYIIKGSEKFAFPLDSKGGACVYTLTWGDGSYKLQILQQVSGNNYAVGLSTDVSLNLGGSYAPFLCPSQIVRYGASSEAVDQAATLCEGSGSDLEKVTAVVKYVMDNIRYDYPKADSTVGGNFNDFIPDVDQTLELKKGICFDYSALVACMLRSQGIPTQLVVGYAGNGGGSKVYHAWNEIYINGKGTILVGFSVNGDSWDLMDTTFLASGKSNLKAVIKIVQDDKNYQPQYIF